MTGRPGPQAALRTGLVIAVEGVSGAGKTTVSRRWAEAHDAVWIPEAWDRMRPRPSLAFRTVARLERLEMSLLLEDARRFREARAAAAEGSTVVLDTDFVGTLSYVWGLACAVDPKWNVLPTLTATARELHQRGGWGLADRYCYLDATPETATGRTRGSRRRHPVDWAERHARVGAAEREFWLGSGIPDFSARVVRIDANRPLERVVAAVSRTLPKTSRTPAVPDPFALLTWFEWRCLRGRDSPQVARAVPATGTSRSSRRPRGEVD